AVVRSIPVPSQDGWCRIAVVWENDSWTLQVDGSAASPVFNNLPSSFDVSKDIGIGHNPTGGAKNQVTIGSFRVSSRARTAAELADYTAPLTMDGDTTYLLDTSTLTAVDRDTELTWQATLDGGAHWQAV